MIVCVGGEGRMLDDLQSQESHIIKNDPKLFLMTLYTQSIFGSFPMEFQDLLGFPGFNYCVN